MTAPLDLANQLIDAATVRRHVEHHHAQAARALQGLHDPGLLNLVAIDPTLPGPGNTRTDRFGLGNIDGMVSLALDAAARGLNVYVEGRTVAHDTRARGTRAETRAVFALVVDSDADKGRACKITLAPSTAVETSPGNRHLWFYMEKAIPAGDAVPLGAALRKASQADDDTGTPEQAYRLAGTPNYPGLEKKARGRVKTEPTRILNEGGPLWSAEALRQQLPKVSASPTATVRGDGLQARKRSLERPFVEAEFAARTGGSSNDRSGQFQKAVQASRRAGMALEDVEEIARRNPDGCASKYLEGRDRLRDELQRSWSKIEEQAERAEAEAIDVVEDLNAKHCVVSVGAGKIRVMSFEKDEMGHEAAVFQSLDDFRNRYMNREVRIGDPPKPVSLGTYWLKHPARRQYEGVTFEPGAGDVVEGRLNLWRGFAIGPRSGNWSLMRQHIREVLAAGDEVADEYIMRWCAWAVQNPGRRAEVALVLKGGRGTGKGTLGNALLRVFGPHGVHVSSAEHFVGRFNAHLRAASLLFADEAYWAGDKSAEGQLKRAITEPTLLIEQKGIDAASVRNCLHVLMASNERWVVPAGEDERRFAVFEVSSCRRKDGGWFKPLNAQLDDGGHAAMLHDLLAMDLKAWHPREVPQTSGLREQQARSLSAEDEWLVGLLQDGMLPGADPQHPDRAVSGEHYISVPHVLGERSQRRSGLLDHARQSSPRLRNKSHNELASFLRGFGCTPTKVLRHRGWQFPPFVDCRRAWEERFPAWTWSDPGLSHWEGEDD